MLKTLMDGLPSITLVQRCVVLLLSLADGGLIVYFKHFRAIWILLGGYVSMEVLPR